MTIRTALADWLVPQRTPVEAKAATGPGVVSLTYDLPMWSQAKTPQKLAAQAQELYHSNDYVRSAEMAVSGRASNVGWHLEDADDNEIDDKSAPAYRAILDLIEKPQAALPLDQRQSALQTRRALWRITIRHMGLCGTAFWYLDQPAGLSGAPLAILYLNPARMYAVENKAGYLQGWTLDAPLEQGGTPLEREQVLPFYFDPPDGGHFGIGLVESIGLKAYLNIVAARHASNTLASGGRLSGIIAPKDPQGSPISDEQWQAFARDWRGITQDPDAARRLQISKGPIEFTRTTATFQELAIEAIAKLSRDDIHSLWGVPESQAAIAVKAGLNSGETKGYDEAVLWQGAIDDRLTPFRETVQMGLLDRFADLGTVVELELEPPEFDDDAPMYAIAKDAMSLPLTRNQRLALIGEVPLPEWDPDTGEPLGIAIDLPTTLTVVGHGEATEARPVVAPKVEPVPPPSQLMPGGDMIGPAGVVTPIQPMAPAKARAPFVHLRATVDRRIVPKAKRDLLTLLHDQRDAIAGAVRTRGAHIKAKSDQSAWWNSTKWDRLLLVALRPHALAITGLVTDEAARILTRPKAGPVVMERGILDKVAVRVAGINDTTRDAVSRVIKEGFAQELTSDEIASNIQALAVFDEARAELIARTESAFAYNAASLGSYAEYGVTEVEAIDGDQDDECAERDGQTFSIEEADSIEDHPNGTLDWIPVVETASLGGKAIHDTPAAGIPWDRVKTILGLLEDDKPSDDPVNYEIDRDENGNVKAIRGIV